MLIDEFLLPAGASVFLRLLTEADATPQYAQWLNDPIVNQYLETRTVTVDELRSYIREKRESPSALLLGIFWKENGRHIGNVKLEPVDRDTKHATMGILIGNKEYWGKGVATEATNLISDYAFEHLGMQTITLGVISENTAALRVYEKCGFERIRVEKAAVNHDGALFDRIVMRKSVPRLRSGQAPR